MLEAADFHPDPFCLACFNNEYPTPTPGQFKPRKHFKRFVDHSTEVYGLGDYSDPSFWIWGGQRRRP